MIWISRTVVPNLFALGHHIDGQPTKLRLSYFMKSVASLTAILYNSGELQPSSGRAVDCRQVRISRLHAGNVSYFMLEE